MSDVLTEFLRDTEDAKKWVNQTSGTVPTRLGSVLTPLPVRNQQFADAIASTGWFVVGEFVNGFTYTAANQVGRDADGNMWSYNGSLPFAVAAGTVPSSPDYTNRGDAALRSDLAAEDGASLVRGTVFTVNSISDLEVAPKRDGQVVSVLSYADGSGKGGGLLYWDAISTKPANGGTIFGSDPVGRWIRIIKNPAEVSVEWFGAVGDGITDDSQPILAALEYLEEFQHAKLILGCGRYYCTEPLETRRGGIAIVGQGPTQTVIMPQHELMDAIAVLGVAGSEVNGVYIADLSVDMSGIPVTNTQKGRIHVCDARKVQIRNVTGVGAQVVGETMGNFLQIVRVKNYTISEVQAKHAFLIVHLIDTENGSVNTIQGDDISCAVDIGGGGKNITIDGVQAVARIQQGGNFVPEEMFDLGGAINVTISNVVGSRFISFATIKEEVGVVPDNIQFSNVVCTDCLGPAVLTSGALYSNVSFDTVKLTCAETSEESPLHAMRMSTARVKLNNFELEANNRPAYSAVNGYLSGSNIKMTSLSSGGIRMEETGAGPGDCECIINNVEISSTGIPYNFRSLRGGVSITKFSFEGGSTLPLSFVDAYRCGYVHLSDANLNKCNRNGIQITSDINYAFSDGAYADHVLRNIKIKDWGQDGQVRFAVSRIVNLTGAGTTIYGGRFDNITAIATGVRSSNMRVISAELSGDFAENEGYHHSGGMYYNIDANNAIRGAATLSANSVNEFTIVPTYPV